MNVRRYLNIYIQYKNPKNRSKGKQTSLPLPTPIAVRASLLTQPRRTL